MWIKFSEKPNKYQLKEFFKSHRAHIINLIYDTDSLKKAEKFEDMRKQKNAEGYFYGLNVANYLVKDQLFKYVNRIDNFVLFMQFFTFINMLIRLVYNPHGDPNESIYTKIGWFFLGCIGIYACHIALGA